MNLSEKITSQLSARELDKIAELDKLANDLPGVIVVHRLPDFQLMYMSPRGLTMLGREWKQIEGMSSEEYHQTFFNPEHAQYYVPKIVELISSNTDDVVSYFQQVRTSKDRDWDWYMSLTKILTRNDQNIPSLAVTIAMKIDPNHYFTAKASRLLEENSFLKKNYDKFASLTKREKEVLKLLGAGKSCSQIAASLHISVTTAETHRKRIRNKLQIKNSVELAKYSEAFEQEK